MHTTIGIPPIHVEVEGAQFIAAIAPAHTDEHLRDAYVAVEVGWRKATDRWGSVVKVGGLRVSTTLTVDWAQTLVRVTRNSIRNAQHKAHRARTIQQRNARHRMHARFWYQMEQAQNDLWECSSGEFWERRNYLFYTAQDHIEGVERNLEFIKKNFNDAADDIRWEGRRFLSVKDEQRLGSYQMGENGLEDVHLHR